ncbi:MAG TPA: PilW family protein [Cellvibrio sp.]|nr:PilW family protein [Cellvibrio sp.]
MLRQKGLSLVELMIAVTLGLILMTGVMQVFLSSKTVFSSQQALSRVQETGRLGIEFLSRDIRMAGYMGCATRVVGMEITNTLKDSDKVLYDFGSAVNGYTDKTLPGGTVGETLVVDTDVLVVRSAAGSGVRIAKNNTADDVFIAKVGNVEAGVCAGGKDRISGVCEKDIVAVTDCEKSRIFQVSSLALGSGADADKASVGHDGTSMTPGNAHPVWGGVAADASETFTAGAELLAATTNIYFIAKGVSGRPSLWQSTNGISLELLEGVDDISMLYGVDTNADYVPDKYVKSGAVAATEWPKVVAIKIELLVASFEDNVLPEKQKYTFAGEVKTPDDRRLRQVFTATVGIRSRLL